MEPKGVDAELAEIDIMLAGTDQPVEIEQDEDSFFMVATPPQADPVMDTVEDEAVLLEEAPSPTPNVDAASVGLNIKPFVRKDRASAFADRIAEERARSLLGEDFEPITDGMKAAPKKVAEKVYNTLCHVAGRGKLSAFTKTALKALKDNPEGVSNASLQKAFELADYTPGTAKSQASQQMSVLPILRVAQKNPAGLLVINPDSRIMTLLEARDTPANDDQDADCDGYVDLDADSELLATV